MSRELLLLRHGKSKRTDKIEDFDRPLNKRGKQDAIRIGLWLREQKLTVDFILSSPAKRALSTATRVLASMVDSTLTVTEDRRIYLESFARLKAVLAECPKEYKRILIVGHNPDLEDLLIHLVGLKNLPEANKLMPTAALARLAIPADEWTELNAGCAKLLSVTYAKDLPELSEESSR